MRRRGDILRGGVADEMRPEDFDPEELRRGAEHEMEHTDDPSIAQEIAMDHLASDAHYYAHLEAMEAAADEKNAKVRFDAGESRRRACDLRVEAQDRLLDDALWHDARRRGKL